MQMVPLIPLHLRILERLREQKTRDLHGLIGRHFFAGDASLSALGLSPEQVVLPLIERALVLENDLLPFHIRISEFGEACLGLGIMPAEPVFGLDQRSLMAALTLQHTHSPSEGAEMRDRVPDVC